MNRRLPPNLYVRQYKTRGGYKRTLYVPRFKDHIGKRRTFRGIEDFTEACAELARLKTLNRQGHDFDATLPRRATVAPAGLFGWIDRFLDVKSEKKSAARDRVSAAHVKAFFGDCGLEEIVNSKMLEYRKSRQVSEPTKNRELAFLRGVLHLAHRDGALAKTPVIPLAKEDNERIRTASAKEYAAILKTLAGARPDVRDVVALLKETGFRVGEVLALEPRDLRPAAQAVEMRRIRSKGGLTRPLPMSPTAWRILSARASSSRLFAGVSRFMVYDHFQRACRENGIVGLWVHDIRGTFVTEKERAGWPPKIIMEYTGHRSRKVFDRYSRPTDDDLRAFIGAKRQRHGSEKPVKRRLSLVSN